MTNTIATTRTTEAFLSRRWRRYTLVLALFALGVCLAFVLNVVLGSVTIPLGDTVRAILRTATNDTYSTIIWNIRLPRALGALMGGSALAVSGLLLQVFFRNPIVGPLCAGNFIRGIFYSGVGVTWKLFAGRDGC